jgi:hypothetical protein
VVCSVIVKDALFKGTQRLSTAVQVNETMFILFGIDASNSSISDIHALDTVNWIWIQQFSASGYSLQANASYPAAINETSSAADGNTGSSDGSGLTAGPIAGIAVGAVLVVVSFTYIAPFQN